MDSVPVGGLHCDQMNKTVKHYESVSFTVQNNVVKTSQRPQNVPTYVQNLKEGSSPAGCVWTRTHQRRWTVDFSQHKTLTVIIVEKTMKKPQPPQRDTSLLRPQPVPPPSFKRSSCPSAKTFSPSSTAATCFSPPSLPTSIITGHDPLGWKLQPKSRERTKRLSLQTPLPEVQTPSCPNPETSSRPAFRPKPPRRRHSEPTAFLKSLKALPVLNPEELRSVLLRPVTLSDEPDDVFDQGTGQQGSGSAPLHKIPPPVPEKTATARRRAHLIASSQQTHH
ncbi:uncharacterized protein LOC106531325 [Austrofundulus limnaeus]|uniref:Uncharacterized protein LOC106531325 n=1 Tax=Austrofundulus limnaeus TaxID=52670 RepID=A0A2I4CRI5_AUSLI|nr:PREDICTED: uncharacterized protein LOC106531325 [Austrofundulus limnaeus]